MKKILYMGFCFLSAMNVEAMMVDSSHSSSLDMLATNSVKFYASTIKNIKDYTLSAERVARQYIDEHFCKRSVTNDLIAAAINETYWMKFWKEHGSEGDSRAYSLAVANALLKKIENKKTKNIELFKIVINGIISEKADSCDSLSYDDFKGLNIDKMLLSRIDIW